MAYQTDPAVPLDFKTGLGYSPNSGPPVGGWSYNPVSTFFGDNLSAILPSGRTYFGRRRRRSFGNTAYPLSNQPDPNIDMKTFPMTPVGSGNTSGGDGGVWLQGMPGFVSYWGYGSRKKRRRSRKTRSRKTRSRRRSRPKKRRRRSKRRRKSKRRRRKSYGSIPRFRSKLPSSYMNNA